MNPIEPLTIRALIDAKNAFLRENPAAQRTKLHARIGSAVAAAIVQQFPEPEEREINLNHLRAGKATILGMMITLDDTAPQYHVGISSSEPASFTKGQHRAIHEVLHKHLDELVADFLTHNRARIPSTTTLMELMQWSHQQTQEPTEL